MTVFEKVVAQNGFAAAARELDISPAAVTRLVGELEDHLGVRLLQRSTRRIALTPAGQSYLDRVRAILGDIAVAEELAQSHAGEMSGSIRVTALPGMATHLVAPAVAAFHQEHPKVTIDLRSDVHAVREIEASDLTLLTDHIAIPAEAVVRRVAETSSVLCASPEYLRRHGEPREPQELERHAVIRLTLASGGVGQFRLHDEGDARRVQTVDVRPVLCCDDHEAALRATVDGAGISSQTLHVAAPLLREGRLKRVLAPWVAERFALVAAFASRRHVPARTRAFLDHLIRCAAANAPAAGGSPVAVAPARPSAGGDATRRPAAEHPQPEALAH
jgi:DNA-binding transcriptional LysR family regulator